MHEGQLLLFTGLLLAAGLAASLAAGRLRLPGLVLVYYLTDTLGVTALAVGATVIVLLPLTRLLRRQAPATIAPRRT